MVEVRVLRDTVKGPGITSFRVRGGVDEAVYPGRMSSSGAHRAGLEGRVERASREPPTAETPGGPANGEQLCVSGRVVHGLPLVRCDRDHLPVPRHHRPNRDLTSSGGLGRGPQRKSHHRQVSSAHVFHVRDVSSQKDAYSSLSTRPRKRSPLASGPHAHCRPTPLSRPAIGPEALRDSKSRRLPAASPFTPRKRTAEAHPAGTCLAAGRVAPGSRLQHLASTSSRPELHI